MLKIISSKARECYQHAGEASSRARQTGHAAVRKTYFDLEHRWLTLARSYEFSEQVTDFTGELSHRLNALRSNTMSIPRVVCPGCGEKMRLHLLEPYPALDSRKETTTFICDCGESYSYTVAPQRC
jgi:hypothetical protein